MASWIWALITASSLVGSSDAYTTFQTNCTLPTQSYNYVATPKMRSTTEIVWTCLATIIACTYSVLHLNVPEQRDGRDPGWRGDIKWSLKGIWPNIKWSLLTIILPEIYFVMAIDDFISARIIHKELLALPETLQPEGAWKRLHAAYAYMGGFAVRYDTASLPDDPKDPARGKVAHLAAGSFLKLLKHSGLPANVPTEADITDKSKSDMFARAITLLQIASFILGLIARAHYRLPTSLLELGSLAFAACSIFSYGLLFSKPKSVATVTIVAEYGGDIPTVVWDEMRRERSRTSTSAPIVGPAGNLVEGFPVTMAGNQSLRVIGLVSLVLGAIHVAGWSFDFPSDADMWLWRIASCVSAGVLLIGAALVDIFEKYDAGRIWYVALVATVPVLYGVSRLVLIVEMIRTLFYLPPGAFVGTWAAGFPHIG